MTKEILTQLEELTDKAKESLKDSGKFTDYLKPWKTIPALGEAYKKATENKDASFLQKLDIFWQSFKESVTGVQKEKEEVSKEADEAVSKTLDETMKDATDEVALDDSVQGEDLNFFKEGVATFVRSLKELDLSIQPHAFSALKKVKKATEGKSEKLNYNEASALVSVAAMTLVEFKKQYPNKTDFKNAFERFSKLSENSKFPIKKILSGSVLGIFKITDEKEGLKFLEALGITPSLGDLAGRGDASDAAELLSGISKQPIVNRDGIISLLNKRLLKKTSKSNVGKIIDLVNKMIVEKSNTISADNLADLVFYIDEEDLMGLKATLTGQR
jgi:hypothetical protein